MAIKYAIRYGIDCIHLFDRRSGLNILCDEVSLPSTVWPRGPQQISIALTNACDLQCGFCYAPKSRAALNGSTIRRWLTELADNGWVGIGFGGGEPVLYPELAQLCEFATRNTRLAVTITTHAHRLTEQLADELRENVNFVRVSIDSVGPQYEIIRGRPFHELKNKLTLVRSLSQFGINCVINSMTVGGLDELAKFAENEGASEILLLPQRQTQRVLNADQLVLDQMRAWIQTYCGPVPLSISSEASDGLPV